MLVKEIVYMCLDSIKAFSDDSDITEEHVLYLLKKYRNLLIKREQDKRNSTWEGPSDVEYQQICLTLEEAETIDGDPCDPQEYLKSTDRIPQTLEGTPARVYPTGYFQNTHISYVTKERLRFVGENRYMQNIIYVATGPDRYLYLKSSNPQFMMLERVRMSAIFDDFEEAASLACSDDSCASVCDVMEMEFPLRSHLVSPLIELVVNNLRGIEQFPEDKSNNAQDDASPKAYDKGNSE
jgi:hypothetical protein